MHILNHQLAALLVISVASTAQATPVIYQGPMTNSDGITRDTCVSIDAANAPLPLVTVYDGVSGFGIITAAWANMNTRKSEVHVVGTNNSIAPAYMFRGTFTDNRTVLNFQGLNSAGVYFSMVGSKVPECTVPPPLP